MRKFNKLMIIGIFMILTGCGTQTESTSEPVSESITENDTELAPVFESVSGILHVTSNVDDFRFDLDSQENLIERFNKYTGESRYSFRLDAVNVEIQTSVGDKYNLKISCSGEKLSDCLGDGAERKIVLLLKLKDSSGIVLDSVEVETEKGLKTGEHFDIEKTILFSDIEPGEYILDIHSQPDTYVIPVTENQEFLNPEKWYTTKIIHAVLEKDAEFPFDTSADWVQNYSIHEIYVDDELRLHGIFTEPYDLHEAEYAGKSDRTGTQLSDLQYGDTEYYDIDNPEGFSEAIPEEAVPDRIRVSISPQGDMIFGERPGIHVSFGYQHNPDDEYNYIALAFESHPGRTLVQKEWDDILSEAEEQDINLSELAERQT